MTPADLSSDLPRKLLISPSSFSIGDCLKLCNRRAMQIPLGQSRLHRVEACGESNSAEQSGKTKPFQRHLKRLPASTNVCNWQALGQHRTTRCGRTHTTVIARLANAMPTARRASIRSAPSPCARLRRPVGGVFATTDRERRKYRSFRMTSGRKRRHRQRRYCSASSVAAPRTASHR